MSVYLIAEIEVKNAEAYAEYAAQTPGLVARHGGKFIIRGGPAKALEGEWSGRLVVMEFTDQAGLESFWNDPEYRNIVGIRQKHSTGRIVAVEGV